MASSPTFIPLRPSVYCPPPAHPAVPPNNGNDSGGVDEKTQLAMSIFYPDLFAKYWLNTDLWSKQKEILHAVATKPLVAVKACHSSGKSFLAARAVLWFLARYERSTVISTAPTWGQIEKVLWAEIHAALKKSRYKFPKALKTQLEIDTQRIAYGLSTSVTNQDEGVKFQGIHNEHVLMILDEAPGVDPKIWNAIEGARAGGDVHVLAIGNPIISSGPFHDAFVKGRGIWDCHTISAFDTPNFVDIPGSSGEQVDKDNNVLEGSKLHYLVNEMSETELKNDKLSYLTKRSWVKERFKVWGPGHPLFESKVLGKFAKQGEGSLISLSWLEEAITDHRLQAKPPSGKVNAGLDVAGGGACETSLTIRRGPCIILHKQWPIEDPRGEVVACLAPFREELESINVDAVGIGHYICKHLQDLKFPAVPIIAQEASSDSEQFKDVKAEFYWGLRMRLQDGDFSALVDKDTKSVILDEVTIGQLAGIKFKHNSRGQVEIESKEHAIERGVDSPDRAESIMLAFGNQKLCYGVLEYIKQQKEVVSTQSKVETAIAGIPSIAKAPTVQTPLICPKCSARCIVPSNGRYKCNQCAHSWSIDPAKDKPVKVVGGRTDLQETQRNGLFR